MYEINEENIKFAYQKLKRYVYYYNSSNYLKDKIIAVEDELKKKKNIFKEYANILKEISNIKKSPLKGKHFNSIFYPKKDSFEINNNNIYLSKINAFIEMDTIFYLNDILFCFELFEIYKSKDNKHFFGNLFDKRLNDLKEPIKNNYLFDRYWPNYKNWKDSITENLNNAVSENSTLIKMDFKRCFYNTRFNLKKLLLEWEIDLKNPIVYIALNVYRFYSYKLFKIIGAKKERNEVLLPVGLPSSAILQNIIFSDFDEKMLNNNKVIKYSRYVDDILVLINESIDGVSDLKKEFPGIIDLTSKDEVEINLNNQLPMKMLINETKIEIKKGLTASSLKRKINEITLPSMMDDVIDNTMDESEIDDNKEQLIKNSISQKTIKRTINKYFENNEKSECENFYKFIWNLKDVDLLNVHSYWNKIIYLLKNEDEKVEQFKTRIEYLIQKIKYQNVDNFFKKELIDDNDIQRTLLNDLGISIKLIFENNYYLFNNNQDAIFNYIELTRKGEEEYFPQYIGLECIELYLSIHDLVNSGIINESIQLYELINKIKLNESHPAKQTLVSVINNVDYSSGNNEILLKRNKYSKIYSFELKKEIDSKDNVNIGVMSVKMPRDKLIDLTIYDNYPKTYSYMDLINNIKVAWENNAKYIVMPEFCIPFKHIIKVLSFCIKKHISLIAGTSYYKKEISTIYIKEMGAINFILIYDAEMKLALVKPKNYYPYEEKMELLAKDYFPLIPEPFYIRIDNKIIKYSTMTCFEATNIMDRAILKDKINVLFMPVYNKDTNYFSEIIGSMARDISAFIVQANNSEYGDSRISGPMNTFSKDIVKIKGGNNAFTVVGTIDLKSLNKKHLFMDFINHQINNLFFSNSKDKSKEDIKKQIQKNKDINCFKPLSAGSDLKIRKKYLLD